MSISALVTFLEYFPSGCWISKYPHTQVVVERFCLLRLALLLQQSLEPAVPPVDFPKHLPPQGKSNSQRILWSEPVEGLVVAKEICIQWVVLSQPLQCYCDPLV